jgi:hypothetical protein
MNEKEQIPNKLADVVATYTENGQQAAQRKAQDSGFDLDSGEIPFEETLINLSHIREVLSDAIKRGRISQIPLKLQYRLFAEATKVKSQLETLVGGVDAVVPFVNAVEDLNATVWQLNLQNLSEQILGFDTKMNELKNQEVQIKRILRESAKIADTLESISQAQNQAESLVNRITEIQNAVSTSEDEVEKTFANVTEAEKKILGLTSIAETHEASIATSLATTTNSAAAVEVLKNNAHEWASEVHQLRKSYADLESEVQDLLSETKEQIKLDLEDLDKRGKKIQDELSESISTLVTTTNTSFQEKAKKDSSQIHDAMEKIDLAIAHFSSKMQEAEEERDANAQVQLKDSTGEFANVLEKMEDLYKEKFKVIETSSLETIEKNDKEAKRLTTYLDELESRIHKSIERATGFSLFHAFQNRQHGLRQSTIYWAAGLGACVLLSAGVAFWLIHSITTAPQYGPLFFMKLAISIPLVFAITFCSVQYSRERRLEEEYAFKSSISISLEPYRKLVGELIDDKQPSEVAKYTEFLIASINRVFTSPVSQVFDGDDVSSKDAGGLLKTAGNVAESLIKAKLK